MDIKRRVVCRGLCRCAWWWNCASPFVYHRKPPVLHRTDCGHTILFYLQRKRGGGGVTKESALLQVEAVLERTRVTYVPSQFEDFWTATASKGRIKGKARVQLETGRQFWKKTCRKQYAGAKLFNLGCTVYQDSYGMPLAGTTKINVTKGSAAGPINPTFLQPVRRKVHKLRSHLGMGGS